VDVRAGREDVGRLAVAELVRGVGLDDVVDPDRDCELKCSRCVITSFQPEP
jgi:hypothetical protein